MGNCVLGRLQASCEKQAGQRSVSEGGDDVSMGRLPVGVSLFERISDFSVDKIGLGPCFRKVSIRLVLPREENVCSPGMSC